MDHPSKMETMFNLNGNNEPLLLSSMMVYTLSSMMVYTFIGILFGLLPWQQVFELI